MKILWKRLKCIFDTHEYQNKERYHFKNGNVLQFKVCRVCKKVSPHIWD